MNEPESPTMAKILIRFNFETEIYVRYRSEEIAPGTLQFHDDISVTFLTKYKLFTRSTRLLDSVDNSQDRSSAAGVISTRTQSRRIVTIVL